MTLHLRSCELAIDDPRADVRVARRHQIETRDALVNDTHGDPLPWKRGARRHPSNSEKST